MAIQLSGYYNVTILVDILSMTGSVSDSLNNHQAKSICFVVPTAVPTHKGRQGSHDSACLEVHGKNRLLCHVRKAPKNPHRNENPSTK